ncbi:MAG: TetR/AcrR family transcriptional regulator [Salinivirgaceae bacterium]|jgi:AcrR family transcriptional regulator
MNTTTNDLQSTEDKILKAAQNIFILYGYHGTKLHQIADLAEINKSAVHYYFRSKDKLYGKVVSRVIENILKENNNLPTNQNPIEKQRWFLFTELYNNQNRFEQALKELYLNDWDKKLNDVKELLEK